MVHIRVTKYRLDSVWNINLTIDSAEQKVFQGVDKNYYIAFNNLLEDIKNSKFPFPEPGTYLIRDVEGRERIGIITTIEMNRSIEIQVHEKHYPKIIINPYKATIIIGDLDFIYSARNPEMALTNAIDRLKSSKNDLPPPPYNLNGVKEEYKVRLLEALKYWHENHTAEETPVKKNDPVNSPSHYTDGKIEVIDFITDKKLGFCLGNCVKYISRAGKKDPTKHIEDLKKAKWYLEREIKNLTNGQ
jgi:hypothetical protein